MIQAVWNLASTPSKLTGLAFDRFEHLEGKFTIVSLALVGDDLVTAVVGSLDLMGFAFAFFSAMTSAFGFPPSPNHSGVFLGNFLIKPGCFLKKFISLLASESIPEVSLENCH